MNCRGSLLGFLNNSAKDENAELMAGLLMDTDISSYGMFESLASAYIRASEKARAGMDFACRILIGKNMEELAEYMGG